MRHRGCWEKARWFLEKRTNIEKQDFAFCEGKKGKKRTCNVEGVPHPANFEGIASAKENRLIPLTH